MTKTPEELPEFIEEEIEALVQMFHSPGWKVYVNKILKPRFYQEYAKLRKCRKTEKTYDKINGFLDGIEFAENSTEETISEFSQNPEPEKEQGGKEEE